MISDLLQSQKSGLSLKSLKVKKPRNQTRPHLALPESEARGAVAAARQYVDYDYWYKLSDENRQWLNKFTQEYYFDKHGEKPLHKYISQRRENTNDSDARRRETPIIIPSRLPKRFE